MCLGNPSSAGAGASPAPVSRTAEEQAYMDKWRQLQKYIEPLKRMINRINEDEGKGRSPDHQNWSHLSVVDHC